MDTDLHVGPTVWPLLQSSERVRAVGRVQVGSGRDGVLSVLDRVTGVAAGQRVFLIVIIPAEHTHTGQMKPEAMGETTHRSDLSGVTAQNLVTVVFKCNATTMH